MLASVTMDVFSVRARFANGAYTAEGHDRERQGRWFVDSWWWQQWECGRPAEECTAFAWVESDQYPELGAYYEERARQWRLERIQESGGER